MRARSRSRIHPSLRGLDRDITPAVSSPEGVLPLLFLAMLAGSWRVSVGVGRAGDKRIADAIAAASRRHRLALRQCVEAARQHVVRDAPAAVLILRRGGSGYTKTGCAGNCCEAEAQKLAHGCSP